MQRASATRPPLLAGASVVVLIAVGGAAWYLSLPETLPAPLARETVAVDRAPMCPWRNPEADMQSLFPGATSYRLDTRVLSGQRLELERRLGRRPTAEENALNLYRIAGPKGPLGVIIPQRVKGAFGAIELVLAIGTDGKARGLRIQRQREPPVVSRVLQSPQWLTGVRGWDANETPGRDKLIAAVPGIGRESAAAVAEGVRAVLNLYLVAERSGIAAPHH